MLRLREGERNERREGEVRGEGRRAEQGEGEERERRREGQVWRE